MDNGELAEWLRGMAATEQLRAWPLGPEEMAIRFRAAADVVEQAISIIRADTKAWRDALQIAAGEIQALLKQPFPPTPDTDSRRHLVGGEFQSDKYPTTPRRFVPLKTSDPDAWDLLWTYAYRREAIDEGFSIDLKAALRKSGYKGDGISAVPKEIGERPVRDQAEKAAYLGEANSRLETQLKICKTALQVIAAGVEAGRLAVRDFG